MYNLKDKDEESSNWEKEQARVNKEYEDALKEAQKKHEDADIAHTAEIEEIKRAYYTKLEEVKRAHSTELEEVKRDYSTKHEGARGEIKGLKEKYEDAKYEGGLWAKDETLKLYLEAIDFFKGMDSDEDETIMDVVGN